MYVDSFKMLRDKCETKWVIIYKIRYWGAARNIETIV